MSVNWGSFWTDIVQAKFQAVTYFRLLPQTRAKKKKKKKKNHSFLP
jgi:hypothetical protein